MARRRESGLDLLIALPWYVALALATTLYFGASMIASFIASFSPLLAQSQPAIASISRLLSYVGLGAAVLSAVRGVFVRQQFARQRSLADLRALTWQQFETIVGEAFRRQGYSVSETGQGGADGGVDLQLTRAGKRYLVQCKQYRASTVSVMTVREIFGVVAARKADGAIVVTTGTFTKDAVVFAKGQPIELIDGRRLEAMVRDINQLNSMARLPIRPKSVADAAPPAKAARSKSPLSATHSSARAGEMPSTTSAAPTCPRCGSAMVVRRPRAGRESFYGCSTFPKCRGTRVLS